MIDDGRGEGERSLAKREGHGCFFSLSISNRKYQKQYFCQLLLHITQCSSTSDVYFDLVEAWPIKQSQNNFKTFPQTHKMCAVLKYI